MHEPAVKKTLYWCEHCNVPLIGRTCSCGNEAKTILLLQPYDLRPALSADRDHIIQVLTSQYGDVPVPKVILLNKTGGYDRAELVIINGQRFGWFTFDPVTKTYSLDITPEALPFLVPHITKGIIDLTAHIDLKAEKGRIGGKRFPLKEPVPEGSVIVTANGKYGTAIVKEGYIKVKELIPITPSPYPDPDWDEVIAHNTYHLKNLERNAVRTIKSHMKDRPTVNVSFSGGKDSTAVLHLARKAGVEKAFFIDTGLEFPETIRFIEEQGVEIIRKGGDFWQAVEKAGPPGKDNRWCCKLLKLHPLKIYLADTGPCVTIQGNRWYESWNRAGLDETSQNPANPLQLNISPIRSWRAFEVFLYLWWRKIPINPLYERGIERIGCYLCPAMLESEYDSIRKTHPDFTGRWDAFLQRWADKKQMPDAYTDWGLWRWRALPPKMRELCRNMGVHVNNDFTLAPTKERKKKQQSQNGSPIEQKRAEVGPELDDLIRAIRHDYPILADVVYLDNAATSCSPEPVVEAMVEFEHRYRSNVGRGVHRFTRIATQRYWHAHEKVAEFIGAQGGITVFTKNTTEAINMVAHGLSWTPGDRVVTTILEHHSNLLPWRSLEKQGVTLDIVGIRPDYSLDMDAFRKMLEKPVRLVAITQASNVLGIITPVHEVAALCREKGVLLLIDGAQAAPHMPVNVSSIGCDFYCFSGHKLGGPTGTGVLWMKEPLLTPLMQGGGTVESVTGDDVVLIQGYEQYEAGTPNIAGGIGLGVAVDYLRKIGMDTIHSHEEDLTSRLIEGLHTIERVRVYASRNPETRIGVVSFTVEEMHPHEIAQRLDEHDILVRSGHHCCQPLMNALNLPDGTVRVSIAHYNTREEIDLFLATLKEIIAGSSPGNPFRS
ncbi:aminotransferase class V-fold PLP-dependent enzyme [Methanospirillum hungatei]|uniref:aminotransferase class V-fold PLP-dependent enzyme n=1 Tax=Methanospirillum hungatei TaxID=2203 RepID=UPI0026EE538C|nr:aminotransferase class V-fold PLP-dependent enzyme [Methanospirillum hungatei]MCA1916112.1 aminotransferase class V-fold PLP-dependent enzyme [Methanospirillum hungatei]